MQKNYAAADAVQYHIGLSRAQLKGATLAVLPGDPGRVEPLAKALADKGARPRLLGSHREYTSWLTTVCGRRVLVCSTGMGGPSVAIGLEELARLGVTQFLRFGTTGTIQERVELGDVIINKAAVRLDGTSGHFAPECFPAVADFRFTMALAEAAEEAAVPCHVGISISSDTFWPGQERYDSFSGYVPRRMQGTMREWQALGCLNYEMETGTLFTVCSAFGLQAASVCGVIAKRTDSESVAPHEVYEAAFDRMIKVVRGGIGRLGEK